MFKVSLTKCGVKVSRNCKLEACSRTFPETVFTPVNAVCLLAQTLFLSGVAES